MELLSSAEQAINLTREAYETPWANSLVSRILFWMRAKSFSAVSISEQIQTSCLFLPDGIKVLEPGCGMGYKSHLFKEIIRYTTGKEMAHLGVDLSQAAIEFAQSKNPLGFRYERADYLHDAEIQKEKYDYIGLAAVVHHAYDLREAMEVISELLVQNGIAIILEVLPPDEKQLELLINLSHQVYCAVEGRREAYYNWATLSKWREAIDSSPLKIRSIQKLQGFPSLFGMINTHSIILQKSSTQK